MALSLTIRDRGTIRRKFQQLPLNNRSELVHSAHKGIKVIIFYSFSDMIKTSEKNLADLLHVHPRTISNYKEQHKNLAPVESEHLLKLIALYARGEEVFGNIEEFNYWLRKPFWNSVEKPIDWMITPGGVDLVYDEIERMAQGYPV